jgi:hypothetical protein
MDNDNTTDKISTLNSQVTTLHEKVATLEKAAKVEAKEEEITTLNNQLKILHDEIEATKEALEAKEKTISILTTQTETLNRQLLVANPGDVNNLKNQITNVNEHIVTGKAERDAKEKLITAITAQVKPIKNKIELIKSDIAAEAKLEENTKIKTIVGLNEKILILNDKLTLAQKIDELSKSLKEPREKNPLIPQQAKTYIYVVLAATIALIAVFFYTFVNQSSANYTKGITAADKMSAPGLGTDFLAISMPAIMQFSRARDAFVLEISVFLLGFIIVALGGMFVLAGVEAAYQLRVENDKVKTALETSSPGLVMISLGVFLVLFAVYIHSSFTFNITTEPTVSTTLPSSDNKIFDEKYVPTVIPPESPDTLPVDEKYELIPIPKE